MLFGQLWVNTVSHCYWMMDSETELIELYGSEDTDSEKDDNNKEKDDKVRMDFFIPEFDILISTAKIIHSEKILSINHPDIITPPPELSFFMS
jgi:hypothetical protein